MQSMIFLFDFRFFRFPTSHFHMMLSTLKTQRHLAQPLICWLVVVGILFTGLVASAHAKIYRCKTAAGKVITSDRPIPECLNKEQAILGKSGVVRKRLKPKKTEYEIAQERKRKKKLAEIERQKEEERKADMALMGRYPNKKSHDSKRALALVPVKQTITMAEQNLKLLEQSRVKLDQQLDFYPDKNKMPAPLRSKNTKNLEAIAAQKKLIRAKAREIERINHRYNQELVKLRSLWKERDAELQAENKTARSK